MVGEESTDEYGGVRNGTESLGADKDGKPIVNHYFAGKVNIGGNTKIVFVRTKKVKEEKADFMFMKCLHKMK